MCPGYIINTHGLCRALSVDKHKTVYRVAYAAHNCEEDATSILHSMNGESRSGLCGRGWKVPFNARL